MTSPDYVNVPNITHTNYCPWAPIYSRITICQVHLTHKEIIWYISCRICNAPLYHCCRRCWSVCNYSSSCLKISRQYLRLETHPLALCNISSNAGPPNFNIKIESSLSSVVWSGLYLRSTSLNFWRMYPILRLLSKHVLIIIFWWLISFVWIHKEKVH